MTNNQGACFRDFGDLSQEGARMSALGATLGHGRAKGMRSERTPHPPPKSNPCQAAYYAAFLQNAEKEGL